MLHIDLPTRADIAKLIDHRGRPAVSVYLRTTPLTQDAQADRIELKNLLREAVQRLQDDGHGVREIRPIEAAVTELIEDDAFWAEQANSLALFATPSWLRTFRLPNRLATHLEVSDRFLLKPLLRAVTFPHTAYVLAVGMGAVRLVEVSADLPPHTVPVPGLPRDAASAVGRGSHIPRKGDMTGGESGSEHSLLTRYARAVDQALRPVLAGHERPLIVAAAEPMASVVKAALSYPHVAEQVIAGSPDHAPDHELAAGARQVLDQLYAAELGGLTDLYAARAGQGRATGDLAQAARAATFAAIDTLIVDMDAELSGTIGEEDGALRLGAEAGGAAYSVTDEITRRAMKGGARVIAARAADIPGGGSLAAILRYPL